MKPEIAELLAAKRKRKPNQQEAYGVTSHTHPGLRDPWFSVGRQLGPLTRHVAAAAAGAMFVSQ